MSKLKMEIENKEMWQFFHVFALSDIQSIKEGKVHGTIEWRREKLTELVTKIDEAFRKFRRCGEKFALSCIIYIVFPFCKNWV